jgi:hypothetical protein
MLDLLTAPAMSVSPTSIEVEKRETPPSLPSRSYWWDEAVAGSEAAEGVEKLGRPWSELDRGEGYIRYRIAPKGHHDGS